MRALFCESLPYRSAFRVGSHHYADRFVADGWDTMWLSQPISALHALHPVKRDWEERVEGWRDGPVERDGLRYYSPATLLPTGPQPILRSSAVARMSALATVPPVAGVLTREGFDRPDLAWLTNPVYEPLVRLLSPRCLAMRVADDHTAFKNVPDAIAELEERGLASADVVFAVSSGLAERLAERLPNVVHLPNGVDFDHFAGARPVPDDLAAIPGPRVLYVGAMEYWFDAALVAECARRMPDASFVLIGPTAGEVTSFEGLANVHLLGPRPYAELPAYLQHCDAGIVPFVRDRMVDSIHPIKVYEYLAAGLPVVAIRWTELERMAAPVTLAERAEFAAALESVLGTAPAEGRAERMAYAQGNSWQQRYLTVREHVDRVLEGGR